MKVLKRSQITEVITKRMVYHELLLNGVKYTRIESLTTYIPYMGCDLPEPKLNIKWNKNLGGNIVEYLSNREIKSLKLEELFNSIDLNSKNGNGVI